METGGKVEVEVATEETYKVDNTPQIAYRVAICPRRNLLNNWTFLYCYLITSLICVLKVTVGPRANLLNIQFSLYCYLISGYWGVFLFISGTLNLNFRICS